MVHVPMGAYPTACYRHYNHDFTCLHQYRRAALDDDTCQRHLEE